ncbi:hypothetical protein KRP22_014479 [Phytophthora ramorum]|nr:hypothetical protein KRP22_8917 [Phytophthora ramorum]
MNKDGKPVVRYQTFVVKWPKVKEILDAVPRIRFCDPGSEDMAEALRNLENVERDGIVPIGTYALTHPALVKTLKGLECFSTGIGVGVVPWRSEP